MKNIFIFLGLLSLWGCNSTPYSDDYTKHENTLKQTERNKVLIYTFVGESDFADVRGVYDNDNSAGQSNIMYAGDLGVAGLIAQVGIHAAIQNEAREARLQQLQNQANAGVQDLIEFSADLSLGDLVGDYKHKFSVADDTLDSHKLHIKPIFFSNAKKTMLHMRMVAWIPDGTGKKKPQYKYKNAVQVYSNKFSQDETAQLLTNKDFLSQQLSDLLQMGLYMLENDINGEFDALLNANKHPSKSYVVGDIHSRVHRANLITSQCDFDIIKDLHSWLIAFKVQDRPACVGEDLGN